MVPLVMQNKPPVVEGREGDELADVELRPEQVITVFTATDSVFLDFLSVTTPQLQFISTVV